MVVSQPKMTNAASHTAQGKIQTSVIKIENDINSLKGQTLQNFCKFNAQVSLLTWEKFSTFCVQVKQQEAYCLLYYILNNGVLTFSTKHPFVDDFFFGQSLNAH